MRLKAFAEWCGGSAHSRGSHHVGLSQEVFFTLTSSCLRGRAVNWNVECGFGVRWVGLQCWSYLLDLRICSLPGSLKLFPQNCWEKSHWCMWNVWHMESDTREGLIDDAVFTHVVFSLQSLYHRIIICGMKGACR